MRQQHEDLDEAPAAKPPQILRLAMGTVVALCLAVTLTHVTLVFLHVAPANPVSERLSKPIDAWVYPLFEQNWLLFAPNPESSNTQILARTGWQTAAGDDQVSSWYDISEMDKADTTHNPFPSHTTQNMLRRAWSAYLGSHGDDDVSYDDWSLLRQKYLRNLAAQRVTAHSPQPFQVIQLKVVTRPIAPMNPDDADQTDPYTRVLPWWNVTSDGS